MYRSHFRLFVGGADEQQRLRRLVDCRDYIDGNGFGRYAMHQICDEKGRCLQSGCRDPFRQKHIEGFRPVAVGIEQGKRELLQIVRS